jgi:transcriptional regulator with XRE-family HTH domain
MQHLPCKEPVVAAQWLTMSDHDPDSSLPLGQRVKQLRAEHGWSQADLAAKIGTDAGQISRYENGRMSPSAEAVVRLAEILDVSTDYLLIDQSPRRPLHAPENALGEHINTLAELSPDELSVIRSVIDGLVAKSRLRTLAGGLS